MDKSTSNRLNHMLRVTENMKELAQNVTDNLDYINDMYILGFLHDIGRFIDSNNHEEVGANYLKGYKYSEEIRNHGRLSKYKSKELDMLYLSDMTASPNGEKISIEDRLKDIGDRYGIDSKVYRDSLGVYNYLKKRYDIVK